MCPSWGNNAQICFTLLKTPEHHGCSSALSWPFASWVPPPPLRWSIVVRKIYSVLSRSQVADYCYEWSSLGLWFIISVSWLGWLKNWVVGQVQEENSEIGHFISCSTFLICSYFYFICTRYVYVHNFSYLIRHVYITYDKHISHANLLKYVKVYYIRKIILSCMGRYVTLISVHIWFRTCTRYGHTHLVYICWKIETYININIFVSQRQNSQKNVCRSCHGNSGFIHDLIFVEVSDGIFWFIIEWVCKRFRSC